MPPRNFSWLRRLVLALAILFAVTVLGFWLARERYENRLRQQIWPSDAPKISIVSNSVTNTARTVLLLGDSRIAQWGLPELAHWHVVNAGIGGLTTGQILLCTPKLLEEFHPNTVVLQAGINDLKFLGLRPEMISTIVSLAMSNLMAIVSECTKRDCKIIVLETWPAGEPSMARRLVWSAAIPVSVNQLNAQLRALNSPEQGIRVIDLFSEAGLKPGIELYHDTLHFTTEAYERLTPALKKTLDEASPSAK
ncbi:MAG: GDSL-type esterase/lipase family protein [Limisphaerales bacterium]